MTKMFARIILSSKKTKPETTVFQNASEVEIIRFIRRRLKNNKFKHGFIDIAYDKFDEKI